MEQQVVLESQVAVPPSNSLYEMANSIGELGHYASSTNSLCETADSVRELGCYTPSHQQYVSLCTIFCLFSFIFLRFL